MCVLLNIIDSQLSFYRFSKDIEHYEPSDSEDEYTEKEKQLLKKTRSKPAADSDSEVYVYFLENKWVMSCYLALFRKKSLD